MLRFLVKSKWGFTFTGTWPESSISPLLLINFFVPTGERQPGAADQCHGLPLPHDEAKEAPGEDNASIIHHEETQDKWQADPKV